MDYKRFLLCMVCLGTLLEPAKLANAAESPLRETKIGPRTLDYAETDDEAADFVATWSLDLDTFMRESPGLFSSEESIFLNFRHIVETKARLSSLSKTFIKCIKEKALQGNPRMQTVLGWMYLDGSGVKKDHQKAVKLYTQAANQGYAIAQVNLGATYHTGFGAKIDYQKALEFYTKAANQGQNLAQYLLGRMYEDGNGVEKNHQKALELYIQAANQGCDLAQYRLREIYLNDKDLSDNEDDNKKGKV